MELLVNDLSFDGQFSDVATFRGAIRRVMNMRVIARQFGRELCCHRNIACAKATHHLSMQQAIQSFEKNEQRSVMQWLTRVGPFWEDSRNHSLDDYMECNGEVVTDTAVGEAAYRCFHRVHCDLVSLTPSSWEFSPIIVKWFLDGSDNLCLNVINHWDEQKLENALREASFPIESWEQLESVSNVRCLNLIFLKDSFVPLRGHPFIPSAAHRILFLLETLNRFRSCFDQDGHRTTEGHEIYRSFFTGRSGGGGGGALFSDSSADEKVKFKMEMTFKHPANSSGELFCPWHGKVQTPQLRVHFSYPVRANEPLYIVYVGPKITKK